MFRLQKIGRESSDCTAWYKVILNQSCTLKEFVDYILFERSNQWGAIQDMTKDPGGNILLTIFPRYRYKRGQLMDFIPEDVLNKKVVRGTANGGWNMMNYYIVLED